MSTYNQKDGNIFENLEDDGSKSTHNQIEGLLGDSELSLERTFPISSQDLAVPFATLGDEGAFPMAVVKYRILSHDFGQGEMPRSLPELTIMRISGMIRDKPNWWEKVFDTTLIAKWRQEWIDAVPESEQELEHFNEREYKIRQFNFAIAETQWLAKQLQKGPSRPAAVDGVFCCDISSQLQQDLLEQMAVLRSKPANGSNREDRHPGSPQIVDLVHPSLYCYKAGETRVLPGVGAEVLQQPNWFDFLGTEGVKEQFKESFVYAFSESPNGLQWLPSEFHVVKKSDGCQACKINSYINNLHPEEYPDLYDLIGQLFCQATPALEDALAEAELVRPLRVPTDNYWYASPAHRPGGRASLPSVFVPPSIPDFSEPAYSEPKNSVCLTNRPLQVMVKLASIELNPNEEYPGGVWHVEGTLNERIVASACCYLESKNVRGGELSFRIPVHEPDYEQGDNRGVRNMYGLQGEEPLVQIIGSCSTTQSTGRILAWPNTLQHRVGPVRLIDESIPGKRTICCFFLVDPTLRIRSTATVPPQQLAWLSNINDSALKAAGISELAVREKIISNLASPSMLTYEAACERRQKLMDERQAIFKEDEGHGPFYERNFSLCEH